MSTKLSVNINKVATLRNTRNLDIPSVVRAARICLEAGAHGITLHPRPDERHIRPKDVYDVADVVTSFPEAEYNIEGNPFHSFMEYAERVRPTQCTLVPDEPEAFTSNQGWAMPRDAERLRPIIAQLHDYGCRVSLFMDSDPDALDAVADIGADRIELYTEPYAAAFAAAFAPQIVAKKANGGDNSGTNYEETLSAFARTARRAHDLGLGVNAGHDLNLQNLPPFIAAIPNLLEVSIGHALIADALERGLGDTVKHYLSLIINNY
jgi:pyridoxine 5-phosphate synthase